MRLLYVWTAVFVLCAWGTFGVGGQPAWPWRARIATPYDYPEGTFTSWEEAVNRAVADGANVILDWHAVSDYWQALYDPLLSQDLEEMAYHADYIHTHHPGVRYIVYMAPLEYVTPDLDKDGNGKVDPGKEGESLAAQHPDWLQVGIDGRRAVFYGAYPGMPFWVCSTCEDAWLTPANPEYRALVIRQAKELSRSGIDGIWLDVPFLRDSFGGDWQGEWPDVGPYARRLFLKQTGRELPPPPLSPDWDDPTWISFVEWRYRLIREFLEDYRRAVKATNPEVELIVESSTGFNAHTTQTAADPVQLAQVVDVVAHEWGPVQRPAQYYRWLWFLAGLLAWRHADMAAGKPSWLLSYVQAGHPWTQDLARLHAAVVALAGFSYYTSGNETMSGTPGVGFRRELLAWLADAQGLLYSPDLRPWAEAAVVFSRDTLDFRGRGSWEEGAYSDGFYGMLMLLLESHIPFQVVTEADLDRLGDYRAVIAPSWETMSSRAAAALRDYVAAGGTLIATGETSLYDEWGRRRDDLLLADLFGVHAREIDPEAEEVYVREFGRGRVVYSPIPYEQWFFWAAEPWDPRGGDPREAEAQREAFLERVWTPAGVDLPFELSAPRSLAVLPLHRGGALQLHLINFAGIGPRKTIPNPVEVSLALGLPGVPTGIRYREFLGDEAPVAFQARPAGVELGLRVLLGGILIIEVESGVGP